MHRLGLRVAVGGVVGLFVLVQLGALALVAPFTTADVQAVEDPSDPTNSLLFIGAMLVATVAMLLAFRYGGDRWIRLLIIGVCGSIVWTVLDVLVPFAVANTTIATGLALAGGAVAAGTLLVYPEWWVIDAVGILVGAGAAGIFGVSFGPLPALIFLILLAVYDAISVYGTKHMLTLAEGVMDMRVPVLFVVPTTWEYSFQDPEQQPDPTDNDEEALERRALYIGLGDAVMPTILVASAAAFHPEALPIAGVPLPAIGAAVGTLAGLLVLMWMVLKGRAHAGLPLLNGGAIAGYLVGAFGAGLTLVEAIGWPF